MSISKKGNMGQGLAIEQLFDKDTSTYTYLLYDPISKDAVIIDPVMEKVDRDVKLIEDLELRLKYIFETHIHADHITSSGELRKRTSAQIAISKTYDLSCSDINIEDGQEFMIGSHTIKAISTPGHTDGCMTYLAGDNAFTGDALLIRGCGRTDFQSGSSSSLYASVRNKLFTLSDETIVWPAHDYKGFTKSTIGLEKKLNERLNLSINQERFEEIMKNLHLEQPKKILESVPANKVCGLL